MKICQIIFLTIFACSVQAHMTIDPSIGFDPASIQGLGVEPDNLLKMLRMGFVNTIAQTNSLMLAKRLLDLRRVDGTRVVHINEAQSDDGKTALIWAVLNHNKKLVDLLLEYGADPNKIDNEGNSSLMYAVLENDSALVKRLLIYNADLNQRNKKGRTALHWASTADMIALLQNHGAHR